MGRPGTPAPSTCRRRSAGTDSKGKGLRPLLAEFPPYAARCYRLPAAPGPSTSVRYRDAPRDSPCVYGPPSGEVPNRCYRKTTRQTTHHRSHHLDGYPDQVTIVRPRHPFEGLALDILGWCHRGGELHLTLVPP